MLLADGVQRAESHHHANFLKNPSILCTHIAIFCFFSRWRPYAILDLFRIHLDHPRKALGGLYHFAKFGYDRCSSFDNMNILIFGALKRGISTNCGLYFTCWTRTDSASEDYLACAVQICASSSSFAKKPPMEGFLPNFAQL